MAVLALLFRQEIKVELSAGTDVDDFGEVAGNIVRVAAVALGKGEGQLQYGLGPARNLAVEPGQSIQRHFAARREGVEIDFPSLLIRGRKVTTLGSSGVHFLSATESSKMPGLSPYIIDMSKYFPSEDESMANPQSSEKSSAEEPSGLSLQVCNG